jgi:S-adenosyl methyltransferase
VSDTPPGHSPASNDVSDRDSVEIDHNVAHASRVYDYLVGGEDNFDADREASLQMASVLPGGLAGIQSNCRTNRIFLGQAVRYLAKEHGVRQFLDIGPGIPTVHQTHEVAQEVAPESRIVYVDKDPIVLAHAHQLLKSRPEGLTAFVEDDLRNPSGILERAAEVLDFDQPVALVLVAIYHMIPDEFDPHSINTALLDGLSPGSWVVLSHLTSDFMGPVWDDAVERLSEATRESFVNRDRAEFSRFVDGLELVPPGVAPIDDWLRDGPLPPAPDVQPALPIDLDPEWVNPLWAAVGRKV